MIAYCEEVITMEHELSMFAGYKVWLMATVSWRLLINKQKILLILCKLRSRLSNEKSWPRWKMRRWQELAKLSFWTHFICFLQVAISYSLTQWFLYDFNGIPAHRCLIHFWLLRASGALVEKHVVQLVHVGPVYDSHSVRSWAEFHVADATLEVLAHHDGSTWRWFCGEEEGNCREEWFGIWNIWFWREIQSKWLPRVTTIVLTRKCIRKY